MVLTAIEFNRLGEHDGVSMQGCDAKSDRHTNNSRNYADAKTGDKSIVIRPQKYQETYRKSSGTGNTFWQTLSQDLQPEHHHD